MISSRATQNQQHQQQQHHGQPQQQQQQRDMQPSLFDVPRRGGHAQDTTDGYIYKQSEPWTDVLNSNIHFQASSAESEEQGQQFQRGRWSRSAVPSATTTAGNMEGKKFPILQDSAISSMQERLQQSIGDDRNSYDFSGSRDRFSFSLSESADTVAAPCVVGGFDPFATICDDGDDDDDDGFGESSAVIESFQPVAFDPLQTILDDDDDDGSFLRSAVEPEIAKLNPFLPSEVKSEEIFRGLQSPMPPISATDVVQPESAVQSEFNEFEPQPEVVKSRAIHSPNIMSPFQSSEETSVSEPELEPFHEDLKADCWNMLLRYPIKKTFVNQNRFWKPIFVRLAANPESPTRDQSDLNKTGSRCRYSIQIYADKTEREILQELSLQPSVGVYDEGLQSYDVINRCPTVALYRIEYEEKISVKSNRTPLPLPRLSDLANIDSFQKLKSLVHRVPKVSVVLEHAPQYAELLKFGGLRLSDTRQFIHAIEDVLFRQNIERPMSKLQYGCNYGKEEIILEIVDEYFSDVNAFGSISAHRGRVRLFCSAFLNGLPTVEMGLNDRWRRGKEIVGRRDIIPLETEDWIVVEEPELNGIVRMKDYDQSRTVVFQPPDGCRFELMRFRFRPTVDGGQLPLQVRVQMSIRDTQVKLRSELVVPAYFLVGERIWKTPCRDILVRFPVPDAWTDLFRAEKLFRSGRISGAVKGLEKLQALFTQGIIQPSMIEVTTGSARYEDVCKAIVWRVEVLPERDEGSYSYSYMAHLICIFSFAYSHLHILICILLFA